MLTARGWWAIVVAIMLTSTAPTPLAASAPAVPLLGISLLVGILLAAWVFAARVRSVVPALEITREIRQAGRPILTAWAKSTITIRTTLTNASTRTLPLVFVHDRHPNDVPLIRGSADRVAELAPEVPIALEYDLKPRAAGLLRFDGIELRISDLTGLFYTRVFLRNPVELLVLPPLYDEDGQQRADKYFNSLPPPGIHRLRRPGGGSELLDLRDYQPGDPPKMIAWKPSARRDKLITKEYESDVPVRCVLFLDTSQSVRIGPRGETPLCKLVDLAAAIAQSTIANRDLVGLARFDEDRVQYLAPARTNVHQVQLLAKLAESASLLPTDRLANVPNLVKSTLPIANELYPDLMSRDVNSRPWLMYWRPLLDSRWGWVPLTAMILWVGVLWYRFFPVVGVVLQAVRAIQPSFGNKWLNLGVLLGSGMMLLLLPMVIFVLIWLVHGLRGYLPGRRRAMRDRKQLAALFTAQDGDSPATIERYLRDNDAFSQRATQFLAEHHVGSSPKLYDAKGQYRFRCETKADQLAEGLLKAVVRARDNEVYVILADVLELHEGRARILQAVKMARGRHHHVMVIVPWPDDVPIEEPAKEKAASEADVQASRFVRLAMNASYRKRFEEWRLELARAGAMLVRAEKAVPTRAILQRLERLRGVRRR